MVRLLAYTTSVLFFAHNIKFSVAVGGILDKIPIVSDIINIDLSSCEGAKDTIDGIACPEGTIFNPAGVGLSVSRLNIAEFSSKCCLGIDAKVQVCAEALGVGACLDGRIFNSLSADIALNLLSDFNDQCCKAKEEPDCVPNVQKCSQGIGIAGFVCLDGRVFDSNSAAVAISSTLDFDNRCCKDVELDVQICAQALGRTANVCASGRIYDPSTALIALENGGSFDSTCCKDKINVHSEVEICSQALGVIGYGCGVGFIYNPRLSGTSINSQQDFASKCCKPVSVDVKVCAQALGVLGYRCGNGRKYSLLNAGLFVNRPGDFDTICCQQDSECQKTCNNNAVETCSKAVGLLGYTCLSGRVYVTDKAEVTISTASEFDSKCCDTDINIHIDTCAGLLGRATCLEGHVLASTTLLTIEATVSTFNEKCCVVGEILNVQTCIQALGLIGYTCNGERKYDILKADVSINGDFDTSCCTTPIVSVKVCADVLGVLGNTCGKGRMLSISAMANVFGTNGDTFDQTCCQDIVGYEPTLPECSPVCNVVDVIPTCFQAVGLKGYTCAAGRVYKNLLSALLCPSTGDFDRVCCEAPTCDQARGLDGFLCAQGSVYAPSLASVKVFAAAEFNAKCCETNVNVLNLCGNLVGTNNNVCGSDRVYDPSLVNSLVADVASFDNICCANAPANLAIEMCAQALGVSGYICGDGRVYNPLAASIDISFSGNFDKTCCKPQVGLGIQVCAQVLGIIGFTCEVHRHYNLLNAAVAITGSNEFDSHCCQDNTPLLGGLNLFDPLLPDCITFDPNSPRSCSEANQLPGYTCSTNYKYDTNSNDAVVANSGEFSTTCCKQNCLTQTKGEYTIEVYRTCQASHSGIL